MPIYHHTHNLVTDDKSRTKNYDNKDDQDDLKTFKADSKRSNIEGENGML